MKEMSSWTIESIPAFCITLERRPDKWRRFQDQSGIDGLNIQRFLGVDGKTLDIKNDNRISLFTKRNIMSKNRRSHEELNSAGGVGCALSHIAIWQWMVDNNKEVCAVFEDDAIIPDDFISKVDNCIKESVVLSDPKKWDLWLLSGNNENLTQIPGETKVARVGVFFSFYSYVITLHAAKRLLKEVYPIQGHIDVWTSIFNYVYDFRIVCCTNLKIGHNGQLKTEIHTKDGCDICDVSDGFSKTHSLISHTDLQLARASQVLCVGLIAYILWRQYNK